MISLMDTLLMFAVAPQRARANLPPSWTFVFLAGTLALVILIVVAAARARRRRREAFEQFGMERGFLFSAKPDDTLAADLSSIRIDLARWQSRPRYENVLQGSAGGGEAIIADRTVGSGKSQSTSTIIAFRFPQPLPSFVLCPENMLWRVAEKLGYSDIDFDGAPDFSRRFFLHGQDPDAVRALFTPDVTHAFEQLDARSAVHVTGSGPWLVVFRPGRTVPVAQLRDFLQQAETIAGAFRRATSSVFR